MLNKSAWAAGKAFTKQLNLVDVWYVLGVITSYRIASMERALRGGFTLPEWRSLEGVWVVNPSLS